MLYFTLNEKGFILIISKTTPCFRELTPFL